MFSVVLTATNEPLAYFHWLTRLWEFALGGLLAFTIDTVRLPRRTRVHLGWIGLAGLLAWAPCCGWARLPRDRRPVAHRVWLAAGERQAEFSRGPGRAVGIRPGSAHV